MAKITEISLNSQLEISNNREQYISDRKIRLESLNIELHKINSKISEYSVLYINIYDKKKQITDRIIINNFRLIINNLKNFIDKHPLNVDFLKNISKFIPYNKNDLLPCFWKNLVYELISEKIQSALHIQLISNSSILDTTK